MELGGVLLGAGMELNLKAGDYLDGPGIVRFMIEKIVGTRQEHNADWVILVGRELPSATGGWRDRRIQVRVQALKRSLLLP